MAYTKDERTMRRHLHNRTPAEWIAEIEKIECPVLRGWLAGAIWWLFVPRCPRCEMSVETITAWTEIRERFPFVRDISISRDQALSGMIRCGFSETYALSEIKKGRME